MVLSCRPISNKNLVGLAGGEIRFASCRADLAVAAGAIAAYGKEGEIGGLRGAWGTEARASGS